MDEDQKALNETATEAPSTTPVEETKVPETKETEPTESTEEVAEESPVEEGSKKGANNRIRELSSELKAEKEKAKSLAEQMADMTGSIDPSGHQAPYVPQVEPGSEVSQEQLQQYVARSADAIVNLRLQQERTLNRINSESQEVIRTYSQLDPKAENFDPELSESISQATVAYASRNPTASVTKFVDGLMKPYLRSVNTEVGKAQETLAKQVSQAALRPTTVRTEEKKTSEMSITEMEKKLGVIQS